MDDHKKLIDNDHVALELENDEENDVVKNTPESEKNSVDSKHLDFRSNVSEKALSTKSILPAVELSWHGITVKAKQSTTNTTAKTLPNLMLSLSESEAAEVQPICGRTYILNNICGIANPGEVLALMGASGAGKTTLLNILTHRNLSTVKATGSVCLNGYKVGKETLRRISAYVQQDDLFVGSMTVVEHLRFMAMLRMGKNYSKFEREKRVQAVMMELGLNRVANSKIGWPNRSKGISGGERKRLAFASEIMTGPPILFCDEPTSGLDAYLAQQVVQVLKSLAKRKNMTIITTIHQPSSQVFEMFDKVCLLAEGRLAFLGTTSVAINLWNELGFPLPENFNPADHFIHTLAIDTGNGHKSRVRINKICDTFMVTDEGQKMYLLNERSVLSSGASNQLNVLRNISDKKLEGGHQLAYSPGSPHSIKHKMFAGYKASWLDQFIVLTKRAFMVTVREPMLLRVRVFQTVFIALLLGSIYFNTQIRQSTVMNINGLMFQSMANMNFMYQFSAVNSFTEELPIFMREHTAHLYRVDAYFLAKNIAELAQYIFYPITFSTIVYWMTGLAREFTGFFWFTLSCILTTNVAVSIAYAFSCICGTAEVATAVMPVFVIPLLAFGGFYINQETLPIYFYPVKYLSYFGYAYESAAINQWTRVDHIPDCSFHQPNSTIGHCYQSGMDILEGLSFDQKNIYFDYFAMIIMALVLRLIAFIALLIRAATKK